MRRRTGLALATAGVIALAGCAAPAATTVPSSSSATAPTTAASAGSSAAAAPSSAAAAPSSATAAPAGAGHTASGSAAPARISMICSDKEVLERITALVGADAVAGRTSTWQDGLYTCRYPVDSGALVISVKQPAAGRERAWFDRQRAQYPGIATIDGLTNFGLPGASTGDGVVLFLNDGMTLTVDTRQVTDRPAAQRADDAYGIASVVIACWKHDSF